MLKTDVSAPGAKVDDKLRKYVAKKIGSLDKYLTRQARGSAHAEVRLKASGNQDKRQCSCEVVLHVPLENIVVSETTVNTYAAVDIAHEKLKHSLRKYKEKHGSPRLHRRIINRLRRREPQNID